MDLPVTRHADSDGIDMPAAIIVAEAGAYLPRCTLVHAKAAAVYGPVSRATPANARPLLLEIGDYLWACTAPERHPSARRMLAMVVNGSWECLACRNLGRLISDATIMHEPLLGQPRTDISPFHNLLIPTSSQPVPTLCRLRMPITHKRTAAVATMFRGTRDDPSARSHSGPSPRYGKVAACVPGPVVVTPHSAMALSSRVVPCT
ncbi:hypothetical protein BDW02DRAFT_577187 [Decorospora gaudefroyi]|uniref:Uncharacterized protein n=1 Tax=Decorospora gaudefroyi TaxID=184978 RepID=A0A6A5KMS5_9PLEO|nr:hypothetical protein BDW02DRAFT_577187 [Decorospora gaudefroyi]